MTITDATVAEGNSGNTIVTLTISLSQPLAQTATVHVGNRPRHGARRLGLRGGRPAR